MRYNQFMLNQHRLAYGWQRSSLIASSIAYSMENCLFSEWIDNVGFAVNPTLVGMILAQTDYDIFWMGINVLGRMRHWN